MRSSFAYLSIAYLLLGLSSAEPPSYGEPGQLEGHHYTTLTNVPRHNTKTPFPTHKKTPHHTTKTLQLLAPRSHRPGLPTHVPKRPAYPKGKKGHKHPVDQQLFERMVRYARFTAASGVRGQGSCPNPPYGSKSVAYIDEASTTTQGWVFRDDKRKEIIISFPGTVDGTDQKLDGEAQPAPYKSPGVNCPGCKVHTGFQKAWNSVAKEAHDIVSKAVKAHKGYKVVLTGHSLGAAIATLGYASFHGQGIPVKAAYTYGSPRVGNKKFAAHIDKISGASRSHPGTMHRITHAGDPVTQMPGREGGYTHVKTEFWQSGETLQSAKTTYRCFGDEPANCVNRHQTGSIYDHLHYSNLDFTIPFPWCNTGLPGLLPPREESHPTTSRAYGPPPVYPPV